jgi:hypothetical protein
LSALAQPLAERISANWKGTSATGSSTKNFIGGEFVESRATEWIDVHDPVSWKIKQTFISHCSTRSLSVISDTPHTSSPNDRLGVQRGCRRRFRGFQIME